VADVERWSLQRVVDVPNDGFTRTKLLFQKVCPSAKYKNEVTTS